MRHLVSRLLRTPVGRAALYLVSLVALVLAPDLPAVELAVPAWQRQQTQHPDRAGVGPWHAAAHRGQGVKVAILDTGFRGYRAHLGGALPDRVTARSFRKDGNLEARNSQHGILC